jgi:hypothetical protein
MNAAEQIARNKLFTQNVNNNIKKVTTLLGIEKHVTNQLLRST